MAILDATESSSSANSYIASVAEADSIVTTLRAFASLGVDATGWLAATEAIKTDALILAARAVDAVEFIGEPVDGEQSMSFPRLGMPKQTDQYVIPDPVKYAQAAEACQILSPTSDPVSRAIARGVTSEHAGGVGFTVGRTSGTAAGRGISQPAFDILKKAGLIRPAGASIYNGRG